jgi:arginine N-succinyltransferase
VRNLDEPLVVRRARPDDLDGLFRLARAAGPGMTNLPPDLDHLAQRLHASACARVSGGLPAMVLFVLESAGRIGGSAAVWPRIGVERPFYSYCVGEEAKACEAHGLAVRTQTLTLTTAFTGCAEVGGLTVDAALRGKAAGRLAARARYLFIAEHRAELPARVVAELRGWQDPAGASPVWEALGSRFFGLPFAEADRLSLDCDLIGAMAPRHPIYVDLLPPEAQAALGRPHHDSRAALKLLLEEGFELSGCVDVFDGGPTVGGEVDGLRAVRDSRIARVAAVAALDAEPAWLVSAGAGQGFRAARGALRQDAGGLALDRALAAALNVGVGDEVRHVAF